MSALVDEDLERGAIASLFDTAQVSVEDAREALDALGGITGKRADEEILDRIFARFCVGK